MLWQQWVLVALYALNIVLTIGSIDKPRKPIDGPTGAIMVLIFALMIWLVVSI